MAKKVRTIENKNSQYPLGYKMFLDAHQYISRKYTNATVGSWNEMVAWMLLEEDATTRKFHPEIDTEKLDDTLNRVVMGRKDQTDTNTLVRVCAIASALLAQNEEVQKKKAQEHKESCDCEDCSKEVKIE